MISNCSLVWLLSLWLYLWLGLTSVIIIIMKEIWKSLVKYYGNSGLVNGNSGLVKRINHEYLK